MDLLTINDISQQSNNGNGSAIDDTVGPDEKLEGPIIGQIWKRSGLQNSRLAEIWLVLSVLFNLIYFDFVCFILGTAVI